MKGKTTEFGFEFGPVGVERLFADDKKGWVVLGIKTAKADLQVYVTKTGKVRVSDSRGEWKPPEPLQQL